MTSDRRVGQWTTRSGNAVDVYMIGGLADEWLLRCEWHRFPISAADADHWTARILPEVAGRVRELLEKTGSVLVIQT